MPINYANVDPPTSLQTGRTFILNDTFDTGTTWVRTTSGGYVWQEYFGSDFTAITSNTISPYLDQPANPGRAVNTNTALPTTFSLEMDVYVSRGISNDITFDISEFYFSSAADQSTWENITFFVNGSTELENPDVYAFYYESSGLEYHDAVIYTGITAASADNVKIKVEVTALTLDVFINDVLYGSFTRYALADTDWYFNTYNQAVAGEDFAWRRVTIYGDARLYAFASDEFSTIDAASPSRLYDIASSDGVEFDLTLTDTRRIDIAIAANLELSEAISPQAILLANVADSVVFRFSLPDSSDQFEAWVVNANTFAASRYEGYGFNSFARIGQTYLGAKSGGIYELSGSDDDGVDINASVLTGKEDFGSYQLKAMYNAVLGVSTDGDMFLRVVHENAPSYDYKLRVTSDNTMRNARVDIGRGMALRYWQFEVYNANGDDFELESMKLYPVVLSRRVAER